ncbi:hypothetical protein X728_02655 [Mesorhizobium sp. L103C120A0]|nr:hypothetical protein X728_02655 [Mesorhizobium sp. L103C120A0]
MRLRAQDQAIGFIICGSHPVAVAGHDKGPCHIEVIASQNSAELSG